MTDRPWLLALVPWIGFIGATVVAAAFNDRTSIAPSGYVLAAPLYLAFVALPSWFPIAAVPPGSSRIGVTIVMTVVAAVAGVAVVATDDAQAGLAVLFVAWVAIPLGIVLHIGRAIAARMR